MHVQTLQLSKRVGHETFVLRGGLVGLCSKKGPYDGNKMVQHY